MTEMKVESLDAFRKAKTRKLAENVMQALLDHPEGLTNYELHLVTRTAINRITPMTNKLDVMNQAIKIDRTRKRKDFVVSGGDPRMDPENSHGINMHHRYWTEDMGRKPSVSVKNMDALDAAITGLVAVGRRVPDEFKPELRVVLANIRRARGIDGVD